MAYDPLVINPPLYLASATTACWKCGVDMTVVALIAPNNSISAEVAILSNIEQLPDPLRQDIQRRFPSFKLKYSKTAQSKYYANTCPKCGVICGDFFLHSEPDSPFFPTDETEAARLTIEEVPLSGPLELDAACGFGLGEMILAHAQKRVRT
jgi:hypothetical protein